MRLPSSLLVLTLTAPALALEPIPDKLVVLTFDDASKSHFTVARPAAQEARVRRDLLRHRGVRLPDQQDATT